MAYLGSDEASDLLDSIAYIIDMAIDNQELAQQIALEILAELSEREIIEYIGMPGS